MERKRRTSVALRSGAGLTAALLTMLVSVGATAEGDGFSAKRWTEFCAAKEAKVDARLVEDPDDLPQLFNKSSCLIERNALVEAELLVRRGLAIDDQHRKLRSNLAIVLMRSERRVAAAQQRPDVAYELAEEALLRAGQVQQRSNHVDALWSEVLLNAGLAAAHRGRSAEASRYAEEAIAAAPGPVLRQVMRQLAAR